MRLRKLQTALWEAVAQVLIGTAGFMLGARNEEPVAAAIFQPSFAVVDAAGRERTDEEFRGKYLLIFFGFTNCPDERPTTLAEVAEVMEGLGNEASEVQPRLISVDPERDRQIGLEGFTGAFRRVPISSGRALRQHHRLSRGQAARRSEIRRVLS